jgi:hypothetical protein
VQFLLAAAGGVARGRPVQVWGTGETLQAWVGHLRLVLMEWAGAGFAECVPAVAAAEEAAGAAGAAGEEKKEGAGAVEAGAAARAAGSREQALAKAAEAVVRGIEYKPGQPVGKKRIQEEDKQSREETEAAGVRFSAGSDVSGRPHPPPLRLFPFGMEKARRKVRRCRLTLSKYALNAPMLSALETKIWRNAFKNCF